MNIFRDRESLKIMINKITFIEQYNNTMKFVSGYYSEPYLGYIEELTDDLSEVVKSKQFDLGSKEYVTKINLGKPYRIVIRDEKSKDVSKSNVFYSGNLTIKEMIAQIFRLSNIDKEKIEKEYNKLMYSIEGYEWTDLIKHVAQLYKNGSKETKYSFYCFLQELVKRYNYLSSENNAEVTNLDEHFGTITFNDSTTKAIFSSVDSGEHHSIINNFISDTQKTRTTQDALYIVYLYKNELLTAKYFYFEPNDEMKKVLRETRVTVENKKNEAASNNLSVPSVYVDLDEEEKEHYQLEQLIRPKNIFVKLPEVYMDYPNIKFEFDKIKCLDFIKASPFKYYLTINETDVLYNPTVNRRIEIDPEYGFLFVNIRDYELRNEEYFYYIEDENGMIISDIHILRREDREIEVFEDYLLKKKDICMIEYNKKINTLMEQMRVDDKTRSFVKKLVDKISHNDSLALLDILSKEINTIPNKFDEMLSILHTLLVNQTLYSEYDKDICSELKYKAYGRTIALSSRKPNTLFQITQIGAKNENIYNEIYVNVGSDTAADFVINRNTKYCFIRAIDLDTGNISGFVLFNFPSNTSTYYVREYLVKLTEVASLGGNYTS